MPARTMTETDVPAVVEAWNQNLVHDSMTERRFRRFFLGDPNYEPEGLLLSESKAGHLLGFAGVVVRRTIEGRDGGGREAEFSRGFLKAFFAADGSEGKAAALLEAAEDYVRQAGKTTMLVTQYTGPYVTPGVDVRYVHLRDLLLARGYRDLYTIEDVSADLTHPRGPEMREEAAGKMAPDVSVTTWDPARLPQMREFVAEGKMPQWFPVGWEERFSAPRDNVFTLQQGEEILGWAQYSPGQPRAGFGPILVLPRVRGKAYGAILLLECMVRAHQAGAQTMEAGWANTGFYVRHGWGITRRYAVLTKELMT